MNNYLQQFPEQFRQFVHNRFTQAYVFTAQSYDFGSDDTIDLAQGPRAMKTRVIDCCEELLETTGEEEVKTILNQIITSVDEADSFLVVVKTGVDQRWQAAREYSEAHPRAPRKPSEPPSEKQLGFLRSLGCIEVPKTKTEASNLINKYNKK